MDLLAHQATASFFFAGARFFGLGLGVSSPAGASGAGAAWAAGFSAARFGRAWAFGFSLTIRVM
jgi:hypothetical protein